ncbi:hypothetical protein BDC45DRAFT_429197, partial [Circinella umbellata]
IDPILHLPAFSRDRHRLVKWHMHWLLSYPLKNCRCGTIAANREHYKKYLNRAFGNLPTLSTKLQPLDFINNRLPRFEIGFSLGRWKKTWSSLNNALREIDRLNHPDDDF